MSTKAPFLFEWNDVEPGNYVITAKVVDTLEIPGESNPVNITVIPESPITITPSDVTQAKAFPNPWRGGVHGAASMGFSDVPVGGSIKIFSLSGKHIRTLINDIGNIRWDLTDKNGEKVSSGVYLYVAEFSGSRKKGKFAVIR